MPGLNDIIGAFFAALNLLILVYVIGSWVPSLHRHSWFRSVRLIVEPLLRPFQRLLPARVTGGLDLSPIFLLIALSLVQQLLIQIV